MKKERCSDIDKILVDNKNNEVKINVNTKIYGLYNIFRAAQKFTESCFVLVDGDPIDVLQVTLKPKTKEVKLEILGYEFYNCLLSTLKEI